MKAHSGQVVLYLALMLIVIAFLVLMNVGTFLGVSARNTTMNGGDAAALAVAQYQGELLNKIGTWNLAHLKAAWENNTNECEEIAMKQMRSAFLDPLEGIRIGNEAAKENRCDRNDRMRQILATHANDVRTFYAANPDIYPEPWEGAWMEYAQRLELAIGEGIWAGPDNIDFLNAATGHLLLDQSFYLAIAGRNWCWFHFHAPGLLGSYSNFRDWEPLPGRDEATRQRKCVNSEVYSLNLDRREGSAVELLGKSLVRQLLERQGLEVAEDDIVRSPLLNDRTQKWFFFDTIDPWRVWWEIDPMGEWEFPAMGRVKKEFDIRGCAAICRVSYEFSTVVDDAQTRESVWSAAAKPFGSVENEDGELDVVTAQKGFVLPAFTDVKLVPLDTVGGRDLATANPEWMAHVHDHLGDYLDHGPNRLRSCFYCQQLVDWEKPTIRSTGERWLKYHSKECVRPSGGGSGHGGSAHGH